MRQHFRYRSLALVLEEFYEQIPHVAVSAATGQGMDRLVAALETCRAQYEELYRPELEAKRKVGGVRVHVRVQHL